MEIISVLILIFIIIGTILGVILHVVDSFLKKLFKPNEEYLLEINNFKFSDIKGVIEPLIIVLATFTKSQIMSILSVSIVVVFELVYFLFKLRYLKSKEESRNTIKYFIFKTLFGVFAMVTALTYFFAKIVE